MVLGTPGRQPVYVQEVRVGREVAVWGRLDASTVADVRVALHEILARGSGDLLIHLAQAEIHDATGLGVIVGVHHRARRLGRRLILVDVSPRLDRLLRASRLNRVLERAPLDEGVTAVPGTRAVPSTTRAVPPAPEAGQPSTETRQPPTETVAPFTD
jgi:anti-anti-sigma factor